MWFHVLCFEGTVTHNTKEFVSFARVYVSSIFLSACLLYKQAKHVNPKASVPLKPLEENHMYERDYNENSVIHKLVSNHHHLRHERMAVTSSSCQAMPCHAMTGAITI